jgi:hypothetical protein
MDEEQMAAKSRMGPAASADRGQPSSGWQGVEETPRLITPQEAVERIGALLPKGGDERRQHLMTIAGIAIAAVIALDGIGTEVENIAGLQECVNSSLFVSNLQ